MQFLVLVIVALVAVALAAKKADEITSLPGWKGDLPSKQYSGYLSASGGTNLHYWFVSSEKAPESAPTVLWLNGGPGCSSLDGFIYEMGPFEVQDDNTLLERPYRWNKEVNMLYIEAPVGVGFSYNSNGDYKCSDDRTALENMEAVEAFFQDFPEFKNSLYIVGESYAGVYVPTLAEAIVKATKEGTYTGAPLKGIAVGNGCSGTEVGICGNGPQGTAYEWGYLMQTAFVSNALKLQINKACDWEAAAKNELDAMSPECVGLLNQASTQIGHVNTYDVYGDCVTDSGCPKDDKFTQTYLTDKVGGELLQRGKVPHRATYEVSEASAGGEVKRHSMMGPRIANHGPDACINSRAASSYLNQPAVQKALHVQQQESESNGQTCWSVCGTAPGWSYNSTRTNLPRDTYPLLVSNIRVTVYNGDWDACVPFTDGEGWTSGMQLPIKKPWHSWAYTSTDGADNQVAGYATEYDVSNFGSGSFQFITIKGGRHEVPETAPAQAYEMISRITGGEVF